MKQWSVFLMRVAIGLLLVIWGLIKLASPEAAIGVSDKYYIGLISAEVLQRPLGAAEALLGVLVTLGLFRRLALPLAAVVLVGGAVAIWRYLLDPLGLYLLDAGTRQVLFFPSLTVAAASLAVIAFKDEDAIALDRLFKRPA